METFNNFAETGTAYRKRTPESEIETAIRIKQQYYADK